MRKTPVVFPVRLTQLDGQLLRSAAAAKDESQSEFARKAIREAAQRALEAKQEES